jgi:hypothetical protein
MQIIRGRRHQLSTFIFKINKRSQQTSVQERRDLLHSRGSKSGCALRTFQIRDGKLQTELLHCFEQKVGSMGMENAFEIP